MTASPAAEGPPAVLVCAVERELRGFIGRLRSLAADIARAAHSDVDPALVQLLLTISDLEPVRPAELAEARGVTKGVISRQVRALERLDLVSRTGDPHDARASRLKLSPAGCLAASTAVAGRQRFTERLLDSLTVAELEDLVRVLGKLNHVIG